MVKLGSLFISAEINVKLLLLKSYLINDTRFPISAGIDVKLLLYKDKYFNDTNHIIV